MPSKESWKTSHIALEGGLIQNEGPLEQGSRRPGSLIQAVNFEPSIKGGYRRVNGCAKFSASAVPGSGQILGTFTFDTGAVACRGQDVYFSTGGAWTKINGANTRPGAGKYTSHVYNLTQPTIIICDGVNKPATYKADGTYTQITDSNCPNANYAVLFRRHMFYANESSQLLTFSAPADETNCNAQDGAGSINVGFKINGGLAVWRDQLYVFNDKYISRIEGNNATDFRLVPVSSNMGCLAHESIQEVGGDLVFLAPDGIRTIAGTMRIGDVDLSNLSRTISTKIEDFIASYKLTGNFASVIIRDKAQYRLFGNASTTPTTSARAILGGLRLGLDGSVGWEWFDYLGVKAYTADSNYLSNGNELIVYSNYDSTDDYVYRMDVGFRIINKDNTFTDINGSIQLAHNPFDDSGLRKTIYKVTAYIEPEGLNTLYTNIVLDNYENPVQPASIVLGTVKGQTLYDASVAVYDDGTSIYDGVSLATTRVPVAGSGKLISTGISSFGGAPYTIRSLYLEYALNGRR